MTAEGTLVAEAGRQPEEQILRFDLDSSDKIYSVRTSEDYVLDEITLGTDGERLLLNALDSAERESNINSLIILLQNTNEMIEESFKRIADAEGRQFQKSEITKLIIPINGSDLQLKDVYPTLSENQKKFFLYKSLEYFKFNEYKLLSAESGNAITAKFRRVTSDADNVPAEEVTTEQIEDQAEAQTEGDDSETKPIVIKNNGTKNPLNAARGQATTIRPSSIAVIGQRSTTDQNYARQINNRMASIRAGNFSVAYYNREISQRVMYNFSLLPAIDTNMRTPGASGSSAGVPEVKPGILFRTQMNHKKFAIPGAGPVYQNLGIDQQVMQLVGTVVGNETTYFSSMSANFTYLIDEESIKNAGTGNNSLAKSEALYINSKSHLLNSHLSSMQLNNDLVLPGRELELLLLGQMSAINDDVLKIRVRGFIQGIRFFVVRSDRTYYAIDFVITKFGFNDEEKTQLNIPITPEEDPDQEAPEEEEEVEEEATDEGSEESDSEAEPQASRPNTSLKATAIIPNSNGTTYGNSQTAFGPSQDNVVPAGVSPWVSAKVNDALKQIPTVPTNVSVPDIPGSFATPTNQLPPSQITAQSIESLISRQRARQSPTDVLNRNNETIVSTDSDGNIWEINPVGENGVPVANRVRLSNSNITIGVDGAIRTPDGAEVRTPNPTPLIGGVTRRPVTASIHRTFSG